MDEDKYWLVISQCQVLLRADRNPGTFMGFQNTVGGS